jgi:thiol-disulfide isomerase/thioredoxin
MSTLCWDSGDSSRSQGYEAGQKPYCRSPEGVYDLTGNLWEWVGASPEDALLVGGSFIDGEAATCGAKLERFGLQYAAPWTGFRCCADGLVEETGAGILMDRARPRFELPETMMGDRVVVHVVANGCTACRRPTAALADLQDQLGGLDVLMVVVGAEAAVGRAIVEDAPLRAQALVDRHGLAAGQLSVLTLPTTLVLNGQSEVLARMEGYSAQGWKALKGALEAD